MRDSEHPMTNGTFARSLIKLVGATTVGTLLYTFLVRPWHLHWGATEEESAATLPGDELLADVRLQSTRGITIEASAARIWPWLVQLGQGRGGLYSYDWLENMVGCDIHSIDTVIPTLQHLRVGDTIRLGPEGYPFFTVASIVPERELVLAAFPEPHEEDLPALNPARMLPAATWAFVLRPIDGNRTRLLVRLRGAWEPDATTTLLNRALLEPAHFIMERKMMYGIKERAEQVVAGNGRSWGISFHRPEPAGESTGGDEGASA